jgi:hypothetical protein
MSQLLTAAHIVQPPTYSSWLVYNRSIENVASERYTIRDKDKGLNLDFMSYANFHLAQKDANALLDPETLLAYSEKTLQTFFKHFAATGEWTYANFRKKAVYEDEGPPLEARFQGKITQRVEMLTLNETATWLSLAIILLLILILAVLIVALQIVYPISCMQHHVECLADVLVMVAGSDEFVEAVQDGRAGDGEMRTRLGWFRDRRGVGGWAGG